MKRFLGMVRFELAALCADRVLAAVIVVFLACCVYALYSGDAAVRELRASGERVLSRDRAITQAQQRTLEERERKGLPPPADAFYDASNPAAVGVFAGRHAVLQPAPWAALALGQSDLLPRDVLVTTQSQWSLGERIEIENPLIVLTGRFDLAFVFIVLYPLVILALSYDLVSHDRERGRLALLLSLSRTPSGFLLARLLARALPVVLVAAIGTGAAIFTLGDQLVTLAEVARLVLWLSLVLAYGAFWFACALFVNMLGASSPANAGALIALWLLLVIMIPAASDTLIQLAEPVPSRAERIAASRDASRKAEERADELLGSYYRDHPELQVRGEGDGMLDFMPRYFAITEDIDRAVAPIHQRFERALSSQQELARRIRFVSPALVLQSAFCDLAGTGPERYSQFQDAVRSFQQAWREFFVPRVFEKRRLTSADLRMLPRFELADEATAAVASRVQVDLAALALMAGIPLGFGLVRRGRLAPVPERQSVVA